MGLQMQTQPSCGGLGAGPAPKTRPQFLPAWVALGDILLVHGGFLIAFFIRFGGTFPRPNFEAYLQSVLGLTLLAIALFLFYGLYDLRSQSWRAVASGVVVAMTLFPAFSMALSFVARAFAFPRTVIVLAWAVHLLLLLGWRSLVWSHADRRWGKPKALVVGPAAEAQAFARKLASGHRPGYEVVGVVSAAATENWRGDPMAFPQVAAGVDSAAAAAIAPATAAHPGDDPPYAVRSLDSLAELLSGSGPGASQDSAAAADTVIITPSTRAEDKARVADLGSRTALRVLIVPGYRDLLVFDSRMAQIDGTLAFEVGPSGVPSHLAWAKRLMDIGLASVALALSLPLLPFIAVAVKLSSPGPVFYTQTRVGQRGRPYSLLKFRTMRVGAEDHTGPVLSSRGDPRVTGIGRLLRRYRLDELPQLMNVVWGSMSLVGPRPERPEFVAEFSRVIPYYGHRHLLKPGLTGLAQLNAGYDAPVEEKLRYDLLYAKRYSLVLDLRILLLTVSLLLIGDEAHWQFRDPEKGASC
jgi:lipopolysaccharide/colanic/teichoic acid biosynthesis glycosyltransferase